MERCGFKELLKHLVFRGWGGVNHTQILHTHGNTGSESAQHEVHAQAVFLFWSDCTLSLSRLATRLYIVDGMDTSMILFLTLISRQF